MADLAPLTAAVQGYQGVAPGVWSRAAAENLRGTSILVPNSGKLAGVLGAFSGAPTGKTPIDPVTGRPTDLQYVAPTDYYRSVLDAYGAANTAYQNYANQIGAETGLSGEALWKSPDVQAAYKQVRPLWEELNANIGEQGKNPLFEAPWSNTGNGTSGFSNLLKMAVPAAASFFLTPALGGALSGAFGLSGALGQSLAGAGLGALTSKATGGNPLFGALTGGVGGYLSGGGLSGLTGSTPAGVNGVLSYGSSGASSLPWLSSNALPWATPSFLDDPLKFLTNKATSGASTMLSTDSILKNALKGGLSYALQGDNEGGYGALQGAYNTAAANLAPYTGPGAAASTRLADLYGLNGPDAAAAAQAAFQQTPGYQFARDQGVKALDASAARKGMLLSGNQVQAVQNYGTGLADQLFQQYIQNLGTTANRGQTAQNQANQNTVDANAAYALMKRDKANSRNALYSGVLSSLFG